MKSRYCLACGKTFRVIKGRREKLCSLECVRRKAGRFAFGSRAWKSRAKR